MKSEMTLKEMLSRAEPVLREFFKAHSRERKVKAHTMLLRAGQVSRNYFWVKEGCLRVAHVYKGKEVTSQFFFEGEGVASFDSYISGTPSECLIETLEPSTLLVVEREVFMRFMKDVPEFKDWMLATAFRRFRHYSRLFISRITLTPEELYTNLIEEDPRILQRVPQHYIASYLGITPVSLSRIRAKLRRKSLA